MTVEELEQIDEAATELVREGIRTHRPLSYREALTEVRLTLLELARA